MPATALNVLLGQSQRKSGPPYRLPQVAVTGDEASTCPCIQQGFRPAKVYRAAIAAVVSSALPIRDFTAHAPDVGGVAAIDRNVKCIQG